MPNPDTEDGELDPKARADKVLAIINEHYEDTDVEASISDVLADLRHLCDAHDINFAEQDRMAYANYAAERTA